MIVVVIRDWQMQFPWRLYVIIATVWDKKLYSLVGYLWDF